MYLLEELLSELQSLLKTSCEPEKIHALGKSPLIYEHELLQTTYALLAQRVGLAPIELSLQPLSSGAVPLFEEGFFPWKSLPYPREHALLGATLAQLNDPKYQLLASEMASFQQATLDHHQKPISSLFMQEKRSSNQKLEEANGLFFQAVDSAFSKSYHFIDHELGMITKREDNYTILCVGSGCKSGMGAFLAENIGLVNYGPQLLPVGDTAGFGLAGRGQKIEIEKTNEDISLAYCCPIAAPNDRQTGFQNLQDSGYSALWMEANTKIKKMSLELLCHFIGFRPLNSIVFTFFGKGEACYVASSHKLNPRSLDRYQGPAQYVEFKGKNVSLRVEPKDGFSFMEVIPLAGDESFWGADFLVAYSLCDSTIRFSFYLNES